MGPGGPASDLKQAYGHAFVIFAAAAAVVADIDGARELLDDSLSLTMHKFWDEDRGLAVEEWDRTWSHLDGYRGLNGNLHLVEAMLAAGDATGERRWHDIAGRIAAHVVDFTKATNYRVPNHFDAQWQPDLEHNRHLPEHPFRPFGAMVGDAFEWARLLVGVAGTLGDDAPDGLIETATKLYDRAVSDAWAADGADGFVYTTDWQGKPVVRARMHWVLLEAINAGESLRQVTGEQRFADDEARWWEYAEAYLVDHELGSWHHELDVENQPASSVWSGKPDPYHAYQSVLLPILPVVPSLAKALAER